jgi:hypothetical protein
VIRFHSCSNHSLKIEISFFINLFFCGFSANQLLEVAPHFVHSGYPKEAEFVVKTGDESSFEITLNLMIKLHEMDDLITFRLEVLD